MGLFGNDDEQDARLDALETHIRSLSQTCQETQLDVASLFVALLAVQAQVNEKVSAEDVDPSIVALNEGLGVAREEIAKTAAAAADSWATMHAGAADALDTLRKSVKEASARAESAK